MHARARDDVVVIDNGGCTLKAGLASAPTSVRCAHFHFFPAAATVCATRALPPSRSAQLTPRRPAPRHVSCVPNCAAKPKGEKRLYVGDELEECRDISALALRRPVEKGFVVNGQLQRDIWERLFRRTLKARAGAWGAGESGRGERKRGKGGGSVVLCALRVCALAVCVCRGAACAAGGGGAARACACGAAPCAAAALARATTPLLQRSSACC
jgi:hypothetical protein